MQYKKLSLLFYYLLFTALIYGQNNYGDINFRSPVDIPIYLSGNFGEIRSSHFHAGIDIKTQGVIGKKIYAVEDGYISRIKVSVNSYGKTIYISHPNGYTTVYGHLSKFNAKIERIVKNIQYENNEFEVNYFPKSDELLISKGEIIGFSGNTGSSEGPHLHFEVRETKNQIPVNPLFFNFNVTDNIAPTLYSLSVYPINKNSTINGTNSVKNLKLRRTKNQFLLIDTNQISLSGKIGFGIEMNDFLNNSRNRCGIYSLSVYIDSLLIYNHIIDKFSFSETAYVKSHIDYSEKLKSKRTVQKTFISPNNNLSIYKFELDKGVYNFNKDSDHIISIIASDVSGNISNLSFKVIGKSSVISEGSENDSFEYTYMDWKTENTFENNKIKIHFPKKAFFDTINFKYSNSEPGFEAYSDIHHIHNTYTAINKKYTVSIKTIGLPEELSDKAFIAELYEDEIFPIGGEVNNGFIESKSSTLGDFVVLVDTIAPEITLKTDLKNLKKGRIELTITDDLTGIKSYNGFIDNNWALFEYDQKNDLLFYILDGERIKQGIEHELELFVVDNNDNITSYYSTFSW